MSQSEPLPQEDVEKVAEMAGEPSYISEIARKLIIADEQWSNFSENAAVRRVAKIVHLLDQRGDMIVVEEPPSIGGQAESSPKLSFGPEGLVETDEWRDYKVIHNPNIMEDDIREGFREYVDLRMTLEDKLDIIQKLSKAGNIVSQQAEDIMQDVMERQFREYENTQSSDYNDPGIDFAVVDEDRRKWGLAIEISVRWANPIDQPYLESKRDDAFEKDMDLLIMAPRFTDSLLRKYEDPTDGRWHSDPEGERVHMHIVPPEEPNVYKPFVTNPEDVVEQNGSQKGNPIIVPDSEELRNLIERQGRVGDDYPVVDEDKFGFRDALTEVRRDYRVVEESMYRNYIRESIEPLLWEFLRPYKIEQFLTDMYWDKELNQSEIGRLVDRSGSTIGRWMREWGVIRRGTGAPELSEETKEIWKRMYLGQEPFPEQFSGYRIQAEYNRHPLWDLEDWREWYNDTTEEERKQVMTAQDSYRDNIDYMLMVGANDRLLPSYTFIMSTLKDMGIEVRDPDEAPRVPYNAYPSKGALEYMINKDENTIVDVSEE